MAFEAIAAHRSNSCNQQDGIKPPTVTATTEVASFNALRVSDQNSTAVLPLIATAGVYRGTASGPHLVKVVHLGGLEQIATRHIDPLARRCLAYSPQKLFH